MLPIDTELLIWKRRVYHWSDLSVLSALNLITRPTPSFSLGGARAREREREKERDGE